MVVKILDIYGIDTLADLPNEKYQEVRGKILRAKRTQEDYERRNKAKEANDKAKDTDSDTIHLHH
jgi:hypothetical protein